MAAAVSCSESDCVKVQKIWSGDAYCAFTSLMEHDGRYYCTFREGESHVFDSNGNAEGKIRVITSRDGDKWESVALLSKEGIDLRDPKICEMPDGRLMLLFGGSLYRNQVLQRCDPMVSFSSDGKNFSDPEIVVFEDGFVHNFDWLWDIKWKDGVGYSVGYDLEMGKRFLRLYKTTDGRHFSMMTDLGADLGVEEWPTEVAVDFLPDGRMALMVRCDAGSFMGWWGTSEAPFKDWKWNRMQYQLGGPDFVPYKKGIIAASRLYLPSKKTAVFLGSDDGWLFPVLLLPSDRDTSYPGLLLKDDELWVSYYSCHEGDPNHDMASIYLAKIPLKYFENQTPVW